MTRRAGKPGSVQRRGGHAADVLAAWTALEALSPQTFRKPEDLAGGDRQRVADIRDAPWEQRERPRPKHELYYEVFLGAIAVDRANDALVKAFGKDEEFNRRTNEQAIIGSVLVDCDGFVLEDKAVAVASYAWALPRALKLQLDTLGGWTEAEETLLDELDQRMRRARDGEETPIDVGVIHDGYRWLVSQLEIPAALLEPPSFVIRIHHHEKRRTGPTGSLMNSFFLGDLARAAQLVRTHGAGPALRGYLGSEAPEDVADLSNDRRAVEELVAPSCSATARWPGPGDHPLVMMQQAAVNAARSELAQGEGIIAVNGPPGTGKTTLLRDVIAACVVDRARAMVAFEEPASAFTRSGQTVPAGARGTLDLYRLDPTLRGHEILVASSNNKAVENISKELPAASAVGPGLDELRYFKTISDAALGADDSEANATWGLIAAALGNARNRQAFQQAFWWDGDRSLRVYLRAVRGDDTTREVRDQETGQTQRRMPAVVEEEKPATGVVAKRRWREARERFVELEREVGGLVQALEELRGRAKHCVELESQVRAAIAECPATRPGFFARLFRTRAARRWNRRIALEQERDALREVIAQQRRALRVTGMVDEALIDGDHEDWNLTAPWVAEELHRKRGQLFVAALQVHKAFIDMAPRPFMHNLSVFMDVLGSGPMSNPARRKLVGDLWSTFFLVVPVVSTTFASVERMLAGTEASAIGWLLIDEAGQAVPQAAVGAIMRARRVVVVGDPLQITPVVTVPERLIADICAHFALEPSSWAGPEASTQTLADRTSRFQGAFRCDAGQRQVGVPLLVHRRCQEPMFSASNRIAYDGQMVHKTAERPPGPVGRVLGASRWVDVEGSAESKWCRAEGDAVLALMKQLADADVREPDIFVISPFRIVAHEMRRLLGRQGELLKTLGVEGDAWVESHVGTIHTFQGREAEAVILLAGAPSPAQAGARKWASATPNILNVAVTRAKQRLYVVGSHQAWARVGYVAELFEGAHPLPVACE